MDLEEQRLTNQVAAMDERIIPPYRIGEGSLGLMGVVLLTLGVCPHFIGTQQRDTVEMVWQESGVSR